MKLDTHVHTVHSGMATVRALSPFVRESYTTPERAYALAKARGMDLVAITDHNEIRGALALAHHPDVIVGCEVSAAFSGTRVEAHLGVLDITPAQFAEIERRRHDVSRLLPYLADQRIFTILNHPASQVNGRMSPAQIATVLPWVDAIEGRNGTRLRAQNRTATELARASGKTRIGGSDAHTGRGIGRTYTVVDGARTRSEFMAGLRAGRARVEGREGTFWTMASDILRFTGRFYAERALRVVEWPERWQSYAIAAGSLAAAPLVVPSLAYALGHFLEEARFNRRLASQLAETSGWSGAPTNAPPEAA